MYRRPFSLPSHVCHTHVTPPRDQGKWPNEEDLAVARMALHLLRRAKRGSPSRKKIGVGLTWAGRVGAEVFGGRRAARSGEDEGGVLFEGFEDVEAGPGPKEFESCAPGRCKASRSGLPVGRCTRQAGLAISFPAGRPARFGISRDHRQRGSRERRQSDDSGRRRCDDESSLNHLRSSQVHGSARHGSGRIIR